MEYSTRGYSHVHFRDWSLRECIRGSFDLVHLNWPETRWTRHSLPACIVGTLELLVGLVIACSVRGKRVVLTLHNLRPHEIPHPVLHRIASRMIDGRVSAVVVLDPAHRETAQRRYPDAEIGVATIGRYEWAVARTGDDVVTSPPMVLSHGLQRQYKGTKELVHSSVQLDLPHRLLVAGEFDREVFKSCETLARKASHVELRANRLSRDELSSIHAEATVVVVPFVRVDNTSSLLLSLCLGVPVAGPDLGAVSRLRGAVGTDWVFTWSDHLDAAVLNEIITWAVPRRHEPPDLSTFSWDAHRAAVTDLYTRLVARGRSPLSPMGARHHDPDGGRT